MDDGWSDFDQTFCTWTLGWPEWPLGGSLSENALTTTENIFLSPSSRLLPPFPSVLKSWFQVISVYLQGLIVVLFSVECKDRSLLSLFHSESINYVLTQIRFCFAIWFIRVESRAANLGMVSILVLSRLTSLWVFWSTRTCSEPPVSFN